MKASIALGIWPFLGAFAAGGCFQPASTVAGISGTPGASCESCRHSAGSVGGGEGAGAASSSGGVGTGSTGASAAGSSGGSTSAGGTGGSSTGSAGSSGGSTATSGGSSGADADAGAILLCPKIAMSPPPATCPNGGDPFGAQTIDFIECAAVVNANITAIAPDGVPLAGVAATSDPTYGTFTLCLPSANAFTMEVTASQYPTTYLAELDGLSNDGIGQIPLIAQDLVDVVTQYVPGGYVSTDGLIMVKINATGPCDSFLSGWSVALALPDGGSYPDGGYRVGYLDENYLPAASATSTSSLGLALIYNIDLSLSSFAVPVLQAPSGSTSCPSLDAQLGFTGRIYVAGSAGSLFPVLLP